MAVSNTPFGPNVSNSGGLSSIDAATDVVPFIPNQPSASIPVPSSFCERIPDYKDRVEQVLDHWLPAEHLAPVNLHAAMRYSVLDGGKRVRPLLVYATGELLGVPVAQLDAAAAAIELIHAFSLVHDDLPAMDNDDLRRGRPTTHKVYGDATAILVGDALQILALEIISGDPAIRYLPDKQVRLIKLLTEASGSRGMTGGQAIDLASEGRWLSVEELEMMYRLKTGCLLRASILAACCLSRNLKPAAEDRLDQFASGLGLAFQVRDDVLDVEGDTETIGKPQGSDEQQGKATYPALFGLGRAKARAEELFDSTMVSLEPFGARAEPLRWLARFIVRREH